MNMFWLHETDTAINAHLAQEVTWGNVSTLAGWVTMTVTACSLDGTPAGGGRPLATLRALPIGGAVTFHNALQAVRNHMLANDLSVARYLFAFTQEGNNNTPNPLSAAVLYCDRRLTDDNAITYARSHFLTAGDVTTLRQGDEYAIRLPFYEEPSAEGVSYPLEGVFADTAAGWDEARSRDYLIDEASRGTDGLFTMLTLAGGNGGWLAHRLTVGSRTHTVYMLPDPERACVRLRFRNWFNAGESLVLRACLTLTPSTGKDEGLFGDTFQDWARDDTDEYTLVCDPLPAALYPAALSFARSRKPEVRLGGDFREVIVTGYELERPDTPGTTTRFECGCKLRDRRQLIINS